MQERKFQFMYFHTSINPFSISDPMVGDLWEFYQKPKPGNPFVKEDPSPTIIIITGVQDGWVRYNWPSGSESVGEIQFFHNSFRLYKRGNVIVKEEMFDFSKFDDMERQIKKFIEKRDPEINKQVLTRVYELERLIEDAIEKG